MQISGLVYEVRSSGWMQPEGEESPCDPYIMARVDAIEIDGVVHHPDPWKLDARLPDGVVLPDGSTRFMDAGIHLRPLGVGYHTVTI